MISKKSVFPSGDRTIDRVFLYNIMIASTVSFGIPYANSISFIFPLCMESKAFEKSINRRVNERFFDFTPSKIRLIVSICPDVDLLVRKPFWFLLSSGSILGLRYYV